MGTDVTVTEDGTPELVVEQCGRRHPIKIGIQCTLPVGHSVVMVGSLPFTHYDAVNELAWLER